MQQSNTWFTITAEQTASQLQTSPQGLTAEQVAQCRQQHGPNQLPEPQPKPIWRIFLEQFLNPLIYVLIGAAIISFAVGEVGDAGFIVAIVVLNAILGAWQEARAQSSAEALRSMVVPQARVRRGGKVLKIPALELVPGDVVLLEPGAKVPADIRLFESLTLKAEEALLTGESVPIEKTIHPIAEDQGASIGDRKNMVFAATTIVFGSGQGYVVATGRHTEIGKIANALSSSAQEKPPLIKRMDVFSKKISIAVLVICALLAGVGIYKGMEAFEIFLFVIAVGVSAIPEGLPIALTVGLSIGTSRMAKRNVIVRRLPAVEGLGSCTLIASDKTGTLTADEQTLQKILIPGLPAFEISGTGYHGEGQVMQQKQPITAQHPPMTQLMEAMLISNDGILRPLENGWEYSGDAMDVAMRAVAYKLGAKPADFLAATTLVEKVPYESERKYSGAFYNTTQQPGQLLFAIKGALEVVAKVLKPEQRTQAEELAKTLLAEGFRVLAIAKGPVARQDLNQVENLTLLGLLGFMDPVRPEVPAAIDTCNAAGIAVKMVTGDHPLTALTISKQLKIANDERDIITGPELLEVEEKTPEKLTEVVNQKKVFARVSPLQKQLIVQKSKEGGHFVAVTGDGANDAPALKSAHIGVAMGAGTDLTKDTASIIVSDNNFASIVSGVEQGRVTYSNLRNVIYLLLSTGLAEIILVSIPLFLGMPLPLVAVQLLWLNLVTNGIQDVALAFEKGHENLMNRPPRKPNESIFDRQMLEQMAVAAITMTALTFGLWYYHIEVLQTDMLIARSEVMMLFVLLQNFHLLNCRSERQSFFSIPVSTNPFLFVALLLAQGVHIAASYIPPVANALQIAPVPAKDWAMLLIMASSILVVMEVYKAIKRMRPA